MAKAVFLVPTQHKDAYSFQNVARHCRNKYWGKNNSVIFSVIWDGNQTSDPTFSVLGDVPNGFSKSFWKSLEATEQFIPICHTGLRDGPMLGPNGEHPWPTVRSDEPWGDGKELTDQAKLFWRRVSWAIGSDGKFLLAGCDTAQMYGPLVARQMTLKVYGFKEHIATARVEVADRYIGGQFYHGLTGSNVVVC